MLSKNVHVYLNRHTQWNVAININPFLTYCDAYSMYSKCRQHVYALKREANEPLLCEILSKI